MAVMTLELRPILEQRLESPYQGGLNLYNSSPIIPVDVALGKRVLPVTAALVQGDQLVEIIDERYAGTIGGMFFITLETPEEYRPYVAFHVLAQHAALRGFDVTGLAKQLQAIALELGYAKATLSSEDFGKHLRWRKDVEKTNFFQLDYNSLIDDIAGRMHEIFESLPQYLTYRRKKLVDLIQR